MKDKIKAIAWKLWLFIRVWGKGLIKKLVEEELKSALVKKLQERGANEAMMGEAIKVVDAFVVKYL